MATGMSPIEKFSPRDVVGAAEPVHQAIFIASVVLFNDAAMAAISRLSSGVRIKPQKAGWMRRRNNRQLPVHPLIGARDLFRVLRLQRAGAIFAARDSARSHSIPTG